MFVNTSRELFWLNYLSIVCFIIMNTTLCVEKPSLIFTLKSSSRFGNLTSFNLNLTKPISDVVDYVVNNSSLTNTNISKGFPSVSNDSISNSVSIPSLKIEHRKMVINAGDSFFLNCSITYNDKVVLKWFKDYKLLISHFPNIKIVEWLEEKDNKIYKWIHLTVRIATSKESGLYACKALHYGTTTSINISVVTKEGTFCEYANSCDHKDFVCVNNICQCRNKTISKNGICLMGKNINESCMNSEECQIQVKHSECFLGICKCQEKYKTAIRENKIKCFPENVNKGNFCEDDFDCRRNLTKLLCINNKCDCDNNNIYVNGFYWIHQKCYKKAHLHGTCQNNMQCEATDRNMICRHNMCYCNINYIYLKPSELERGKCYRKASTMYDSCELDQQCFGVSTKAVCSHNNNLCVCRLGYYYINGECIRQEEFERSKAQQVYRTAMIAAACFMIGVVSIFVVCIVKKSFCGDNNRSSLPGSQHTSGGQLQRMTSLTEDGIIVADKPPSYEEVILAEIPNTPPPKYTDISKLFPITEGLQRHSSEPHLNILYMESGHNRSNSFHAYDNLAANNGANNIEVTVIPPPPRYEEYENLKPKPNLHLNIPSITVSIAEPENQVNVCNETETNSENN